MSRIRSALTVAALSLILPSKALATWSVIAVDMATGRVVIASATCVNRDDQFLKNIQAVVVPGKGVAACQAAVDGTHANQMLVYAELQKGTDPAKIIEMLAQDPAFQSRQFGIVDLTGRSAGHSGLTNGYVTQDVQGRVPGTQIYYSIQGNILRPGEVVPNAERAAIPCEGKTSHIAYILMSDRNDTSGDSHANGAYAMYLTVAQPEAGGANAIRSGENLNPVKTLRARYDAWRRTQPPSFR